ncbi:sigma-70 family RNA polymerase sigma factor [Bacillus weihaiensis]|uniref:RNA polymerase n=1 Tax=Bacillus weihaiensis TaxID=1547283 RepID=A0A1L3MVT6_9BACI|nr:sigma-70 family RNA polymerase sigma factor [Bacillus weihaiensis]APH06432.1 RNA polymerase [Bacillus weihaiensis]
MEFGRKHELEHVYQKYAKSLYVYLLKMSGSPHLAEDLTQETFVRATISLSSYNQENIRAWLFKVARNAYLDEWRKRQKRKWIPFSEILFTHEKMISPYGLPEEELVLGEQKSDLHILLTYLPEHYRTILYLREYEDFSYEEIQTLLELTEGQVKIHLYRARKKLSELAEELGWEEKDGGME